MAVKIVRAFTTECEKRLFTRDPECLDDSWEQLSAFLQHISRQIEVSYQKLMTLSNQF